MWPWPRPTSVPSGILIYEAVWPQHTWAENWGLQLSAQATWDPAPVPKRGTASQFSAHVCCDQTPGWIKMPLGTEVDLGPGYIVVGGRRPLPPLMGDRSDPIPLQ